MARGVMILMLTLGLTLSHVGDRAIAQDRHQALDARVERLEQQARQERGQRLYRQACAPCHGVSGDGRGPAASGLHPKPHDFTTGMYKFRSTSMGAMPTDADLVRTIREGIPGTAMPAWKHLLSSTQQLAAPEATSERVQRGRHLYERLQCGQCHGSDGRGKGPLAQHLRDAGNRPIPPTNFTRGIYKSGVAPEDLWRTIWTGLAGTPMPAWSGAISIEEGWDLVYYIRSLSQANTFWHQVFVDTGEAYPGR